MTHIMMLTAMELITIMIRVFGENTSFLPITKS
jgi:hypothetical protein